jgi:hypothetical protein
VALKLFANGSDDAFDWNCVGRDLHQNDQAAILCRLTANRHHRRTRRHCIGKSRAHGKMLGIRIPAILLNINLSFWIRTLFGGTPCGWQRRTVIRDADAQNRCANERGGWILGVYEKERARSF